MPIGALFSLILILHISQHIIAPSFSTQLQLGIFIPSFSVLNPYELGNPLPTMLSKQIGIPLLPLHLYSIYIPILKRLNYLSNLEQACLQLCSRPHKSTKAPIDHIQSLTPSHDLDREKKLQEELDELLL